MNTAERILSKFGKGITGAATALQEPTATVQYWFNIGKIPQKRWDQLIAKGAELGIILNYEDFRDIPTSDSEAGNNNAI